MTATTKPPKRPDQRRPRPVRFFSMETLGFSDAQSTWSDSPLAIPMELQTTEPTAPSEPVRATEPDPIQDWEPQDIPARLAGGNVRWSVVTLLIVIIAGALGFAYWLYQRPVAQAESSASAIDDDADQLLAALPDLQELGDALLSDAPDIANVDINGVESAARRLFEASGELPQTETEARYLATGAAGSALDGVRLAGDARSYLLAVTPILATPELETDPSVIALDDAARSFGDWQLWFDDVRTALPDAVLSDVTVQLDVLSGDLHSILDDYIDALSGDDQAAAVAVMAGLSSRLDEINGRLDAALADTQELVTQRIEETRTALAKLQRR